MIAQRVCLALLFLAPSFARAHDAGEHLHANWSLDRLLVILPLLVTLAFFVLGSARLWMRAHVGRGVTVRNAGLFSFGWLALAAALVSPLHELGEGSLSLHMVEHELLMAVASPLLVCSRPMPILLWSLPRLLRVALGILPRTAVGDLWRVFTRPLIATALHGVAIWVWHVPLLFQAALEHELLHWLQHASFFGTALLFWWALLEAGRRGLHGIAIGHLFVTSVHTGVLGALMGLAPRLLYLPATSPPWDLTALQDQQFAGLIMWVPGGMVYAAAALAFAGLWILHSGRTRTGLAYARPTP